jgi:hypothetical protein
VCVDGRVQGGGIVSCLGGADSRVGKVNALIPNEDGSSEDGGIF